MLAGILIVIFSGVMWFAVDGLLAWIAAASFFFFGAAVVNGLLSEEEESKPPRSRRRDQVESLRSAYLSQSLPSEGGGVPDSVIAIEGDGTYSFGVVGESHYQDELRKIAGPKEANGKALECEAFIVHETGNPHDPDACAVVINGYKVGHLSREDAKDQVAARGASGFVLRAAALIVGGWKDSRSEGRYGVRLDYVPKELSAGPMEKELYRFMGFKVPRNLTRGEAWSLEASLVEAGDDRIGSWRAFKQAAGYLQSPEGREDYGIKKPSLKQLRDAFAALQTERGEVGGAFLPDESDIHEMLVDMYPDLEK